MKLSDYLNEPKELLKSFLFQANPQILRKTIAIESGDVNATDKDGDTALKVASGCDKIETMELLLKAGADVNAKNKKGFTALGSALIYGEGKKGSHKSFEKNMEQKNETIQFFT